MALYSIRVGYVDHDGHDQVYSCIRGRQGVDSTGRPFGLVDAARQANYIVAAISKGLQGWPKAAPGNRPVVLTLQELR